MDYYKHLKILALKSVVEPDEEYELRRIFRWYSKTFATPLHIVEEFSLEHVLTNYFESQFEEKKEEEIFQIIQDLTEKDEDRRKKEMAEEKQAVEDFEFLRMVEKEAKDRPPKTAKETLKDVVTASKKLTNAFNSIKTSDEADLPPAKEIPSDVSISFSDDLEEEINKHDLSLFDKPKRPK